MNMEAKFSALKGYIDCKISILNSKVDQFIESLKETITKIKKRESIEILQEKNELLPKNDLIKSLMEIQTVALEAITNLKEKPQEERKLSNVTYKEQGNHHRHFQNQRQQHNVQKEREQKQGGKKQQQQQKLQHQTRQQQQQQQQQEQNQ